MAGPAIVVIGASQGGVDALRRIAAGLDARAPAIWCVVLHTDAHVSCLPEILERAGPLPARHAEQGERLTSGRIHIAPPDHHLLVNDGAVLLSRGPRVNYTRPAIDPLFQSAAEAYGACTIGVVLTGNLNDGTLGLHEIRRRGGRAVVQDPLEAESPGMPRSALAQVGADHCVTLADMPALLCRLAAELASFETLTNDGGTDAS
jgi:two-component system, chemotaxis family, protein-glutamate methylesterase/glutaminase